MEMIIFSIDPVWAGSFFAFYIGFSAFLGIVVYLILTKPSMIRAEFRGLLQPVSKRTAIICAVIAFLPFSLYGYWDCWKYYYGLSLRDSKLIVKYLFPSREHEISELGRMKVATETEARKGIVYRIKLVTKDNSYTSQQMTRKEFEINREALTQEIQKRTDLTR
jgi:hypothetical protein